MESIPARGHHLPFPDDGGGGLRGYGRDRTGQMRLCIEGRRTGSGVLEITTMR